MHDVPWIEMFDVHSAAASGAQLPLFRGDHAARMAWPTEFRYQWHTVGHAAVRAINRSGNIDVDELLLALATAVERCSLRARGGLGFRAQVLRAYMQHGRENKKKRKKQ